MFRYIGIVDAVSVAAEYDEFADERTQQSLQAAEAEIDRLVQKLTAEESVTSSAA